MLLLDYTKLSAPGGNVLMKFSREPFAAELFPDKQAGSMQPGFDGTFVEPQNAAHFFGAQAFHVTEHQDHTIFARQLRDGAIENLA